MGGGGGGSKAELIAALSNGRQTDKDEALTYAKLAEAALKARNGHYATFSDFIDPETAAKAAAVFGDETRLNGGVPFAERVIAGFAPDYLDKDFALSEDRFPITRLKITARGKGLKHKDYLGAMTSIVTRDKLGDIVVNERGAYAVVTTDAAAALSALLTEVGSLKVTVEEADYVEFEGAYQPTVKTAFAQSLRLDGVLSKCLNISRNEAETLIKGGRAFINHREETRPSAEVKAGDTITARGVGRVKIISTHPTTKDRVRIEFWAW